MSEGTMNGTDDPARRDRLARLAAMPDHEIDTADIPEVRDWSGAVRGVAAGNCIFSLRRQRPTSP